MTATVRIAWSRELDNESMWDEVCSWAIERFGLSKHRFQTYVNVDYMEFVFESNKDALMMSLRWNAPIISDQQLAVETVSQFI